VGKRLLRAEGEDETATVRKGEEVAERKGEGEDEGRLALTTAVSSTERRPTRVVLPHTWLLAPAASVSSAHCQ